MPALVRAEIDAGRGKTHDDIIDAIEKRDPGLAETVAHQHALQMTTRFLDYLGSRNTPAFPLRQTIAL